MPLGFFRNLFQLSDIIFVALGQSCKYDNNPQSISFPQSFAFWVEGVAMTVLGCLALVTNSICIYGFTRSVSCGSKWLKIGRATR